MNTAENLASIKDMLTQAIAVISDDSENRSGEFSPEFPHDTLRDLGAVVELGRLATDNANTVSLVSFLDDMDRDINQSGVVTWTSENVQALETLRALAGAQPLARALDREGLYGIVNPVSHEGNTLLALNDRGCYEDPWAALADLAEARREFENPHLCFVHLMPHKIIQRMQYGASRLYLALSAITDGEMERGQAEQDWAYDTLCEALGWSKPTEQPAWDEAVCDHDEAVGEANIKTGKTGGK